MMGRGRGAGQPAAGRTPGRPGAGGQLHAVRLVDLEGVRRTYLTRETGQILHAEDTILGKVEFHVRMARAAAAGDASRPQVELTMMRGGAMRGGMRGMRGRGMRGMGGQGAMGARGAGAARRGPAAAGQRPGAGQAGQSIPPRLDYGFRLTMDLEEEG